MIWYVWSLTKCICYFNFYLISYILLSIFQELEEAELELDIIQKEHALPGRMDDSKDWNQIPGLPCKYFLFLVQHMRTCNQVTQKSLYTCFCCFVVTYSLLQLLKILHSASNLFYKFELYSLQKGCLKASANQRVHSFPVSGCNFLFQVC